MPLRCSVLPAQSQWSREEYSGKESEPESTNVFKQVENTKDSKKRCFTEENTPTMDVDDGTTKKSKDTADSQRSSKILVKEFECIVYVYENTKCCSSKDVRSSTYKVNQAFEFTGILDLLRDNDMSSSMLQDAVPHSDSDIFLPKMHCVSASKLSPINLVSSRSFSSWEDMVPSSNENKSLPYVRDLLLTYLSQHITTGDAVAAEYLLLSLVSRVHARLDAATGIGALPLNLICDEKDVAENISKHLGEIIEKGLD